MPPPKRLSQEIREKQAKKDARQKGQQGLPSVHSVESYCAYPQPVKAADF
jgi:hypothetical protein